MWFGLVWFVGSSIRWYVALTQVLFEDDSLLACLFVLVGVFFSEVKIVVAVVFYCCYSITVVYAVYCYVEPSTERWQMNSTMLYNECSKQTSIWQDDDTTEFGELQLEVKVLWLIMLQFV